MTLPGARLLVCALLFAGWIGYLAYQVIYTRPLTAAGKPLVVSRPQVLASDVDVIAYIPDLKGPITVEEVLRGAGVEKDAELTLANLEECRAERRSDKESPPPLDWVGAGRYLVPLRHLPDGKYEVAHIPPSPGYPPPPSHLAPGSPRIYPATPEALAQYHSIAKPGDE